MIEPRPLTRRYRQMMDELRPVQEARARILACTLPVVILVLDGERRIVEVRHEYKHPPHIARLLEELDQEIQRIVNKFT